MLLKNRFQSFFMGPSRIRDFEGVVVHHIPTTPSTNLVAKEAPEEGPPFELFVTGRQTAGYGRQGSCWDSPPGNLAFTLLLRDHGIPPKDQPRITLVTGVAVAKALSAFIQEGISLKWPNDILIDGRKLAGILTEGAKGKIAVGVGINVNSTLADFEPEVRALRMTLREKAGREFSLEEVLNRVAEAMIFQIKRFQSGQWKEILEDYRRLSFLTGREVSIQAGKDEWVTGVARHVNEKGEFVLETVSGEIRTFNAGDVSVRSTTR